MLYRKMRMLTMRKGTSRWRAAFVLAALYAFCVLMPHAALAFTHAAAHCPTEAPLAAHVHQHNAAITHVHADGHVHTHHAPDNAGDPTDHHGTQHSETCCGLFCITAIADEPAMALVLPPLAAPEPPALEAALTGCAPGRINRPPIA